MGSPWIETYIIRANIPDFLSIRGHSELHFFPHMHRKGSPAYFSGLSLSRPPSLYRKTQDFLPVAFTSKNRPFPSQSRPGFACLIAGGLSAFMMIFGMGEISRSLLCSLYTRTIGTNNYGQEKD
jgi:hypothetical protein